MDTRENIDLSVKSALVRMYEGDYRVLYNKIKDSGMKWLTISPAGDSGSPALFLAGWVTDFELFRKFANDVIIAVEFASCRMHFHIVYDVKDPIKEYRVINRWRMSNQLRLYKGEPELKMPYLFKDVKDSEKVLPGISIVYDMDSLNAIVQARKDTRKVEKQIAQEQGIPKWMLA